MILWWVIASSRKQYVIWTHQRACRTTITRINFKPFWGIFAEAIGRPISNNLPKEPSQESLQMLSQDGCMWESYNGISLGTFDDLLQELLQVSRRISFELTIEHVQQPSQESIPTLLEFLQKPLQNPCQIHMAELQEEPLQEFLPSLEHHIISQFNPCTSHCNSHHNLCQVPSILRNPCSNWK